MKDEPKTNEDEFNAHLKELNARIVLLRNRANPIKVEATAAYDPSDEVLRPK